MASIRLDIGTVPSTPASGKLEVYPKSDKHLYIKDDTGLETDLTNAITSFPASAVTVVPAGNISATDAQAALQELDTEKLSTAHAGSGGAAHAVATTSTAGFMSAADKTAFDILNSVGTGALVSNEVTTNVTVPTDYTWTRPSFTRFTGTVAITLQGTGRLVFR